MKQSARRQFIKRGLWLGAGSLLLPPSLLPVKNLPIQTTKIPRIPKQKPRHGLTFLSLPTPFHRAFEAKRLVNREFAQVAKEEFGISAVEFLNIYFMDKAKDNAYLEDLNKRSKDLESSTFSSW